MEFCSGLFIVMWQMLDILNLCKSESENWSHRKENLTCHRAGAAMGPAGAAVLGDVLVTSGAGVVDAIDIPPVPGLRELNEVQEFVSANGSPRERRQFSVISLAPKGPSDILSVSKCTSYTSGRLPWWEEKKKDESQPGITALWQASSQISSGWGLWWSMNVSATS